MDNNKIDIINTLTINSSVKNSIKNQIYENLSELSYHVYMHVFNNFKGEISPETFKEKLSDDLM